MIQACLGTPEHVIAAALRACLIFGSVTLPNQDDAFYQHPDFLDLLAILMLGSVVHVVAQGGRIWQQEAWTAQTIAHQFATALCCITYYIVLLSARRIRLHESDGAMTSERDAEITEPDDIVDVPSSFMRQRFVPATTTDTEA